MFGGGEEYFREPDPIDRDTLTRFAVFCARLRALEKPGVKAISDVCEKARAVGDNLTALELVIGAILRHIKTWTGTKQLSCWYVLDKLCKEGRETFGFTAQPYIVDIAGDYIPFEDPKFVEKYDNMIERWDCVFSRSVIDRIWVAKKERMWAAAHPDEIEKARREEEAEWQREELRQLDSEGLDEYGQPCMDYLQGRCIWGSQCKQLHPPGLEGSLPLECRLGDWKCRCGVINRHFRRRCSQCVREKPQYRKQYETSPEEELLSRCDPVVGELFVHQFGYNPCSEAEAIAHWQCRLEGVSIDQFKRERSAAIRTRILGRKPITSIETQAASQINFTFTKSSTSNVLSLSDSAEQPPTKRSRTESLIPSGLPPQESITLLCRIILERGAHDVNVPHALFQLCTLCSGLVTNKLMLDQLQGETLFSVCRLVFSFWNTTKNPAAELFIAEISKVAKSLGLQHSQVDHITTMGTAVGAKRV